MKVITRAAPGCTGPLHLGSLYNIFLNYVFAKRHNGVFFLRLDASHKTGPTIRFEREIEETLRIFGLIPDFVIKQTERQDVYRKQLENLLDHPDVYFCNCSNQDITERFSEGAKGFCVERYDKYPPPCAIKQIKIFNDTINLANSAKITASITAPGGFEAKNILSGDGVWKPFKPWYYGDIPPSLILTWKNQVLIDAVEILWSQYPAKAVRILVDDKQVGGLKRENGYWYDSAETIKDVIAFKPIRGQKLTIVPTEFMEVVQREYAYDGYCRNRSISLDLNKSCTFVRKKCNNFVDVVLWNGEEKKIDLAFRSAIDDKEFGTTHKIRGVDIFVFMMLEENCAELLNYKSVNKFHGLFLHPNMYKLSKSTGARDVRYYIGKGMKPNEILSFLAWKTGLIGRREAMSLQELVECIEPSPYVAMHTIISEEK